MFTSPIAIGSLDKWKFFFQCHHYQISRIALTSLSSYLEKNFFMSGERGVIFWIFLAMYHWFGPGNNFFSNRLTLLSFLRTFLFVLFAVSAAVILLETYYKFNLFYIPQSFSLSFPDIFQYLLLAYCLIFFLR